MEKEKRADASFKDFSFSANAVTVLSSHKDNPTWGYNALSTKITIKQENSVSRHHC